MQDDADEFQRSTPQQTSADNSYGSLNRSMEWDPLISSFEDRRREPILPYYSIQNLEQNTNSFGREEELRILDDNILPRTHSHGTLKSFGICGTGDLGKMQIEKEYVFNRMNHYDAIFWLAADDKTGLVKNFASLATQLGLEDGSENQDLTVARERVKDWLSNHLVSFEYPNKSNNEASRLLVFDNVDDLSVLDDY